MTRSIRDRPNVAGGRWLRNTAELSGELSVGDMVRVGNHWLAVARFGFTESDWPTAFSLVPCWAGSNPLSDQDIPQRRWHLACRGSPLTAAVPLMSGPGYSAGQVRHALDSAKDLITGELDLGERDSDLLDLLACGATALLASPDIATLDALISAGGYLSPAEVRTWWTRWT
jgi:hypothetical protein